MKVLVVGGAGYVGAILRQTLEARYDCRYLDISPVPGAEDRTFVGDINDDNLVRRSVYLMDAVVFLVMGGKPVSGNVALEWIDSSFDANVRGHYRVLRWAMAEGIRRFVYASSLSVYASLRAELCPVHEHQKPDAINPYGISKRMGEELNEAFAARYRDGTFLSLRLMWPRNESNWPGNEYAPGRHWYPIGPNDLRRLFVAALEFRVPGAYAVQTTGDLGNDVFPNTEATRLLGWKPEGN